MKKIIVPITALILLILSSFPCACTKSDINIESTNWKLQVAQKVNTENQEREVIARSDVWVLEDTTIPVVNIILVAKDGKIKITDNVNINNSFSGTYEKADVINSETVFYNVTVNELSGNANVSVIKYENGDKIQTLILTLFKDNLQYTINFTPTN